MQATSPSDSADAFGRLCAALGDPFADRAAVLAGVGLTEASYAELEKRWIARLGAEHGGVVAADFERGYRAAEREAEQPHRERGQDAPLVEHALEAPPRLGSPPSAGTGWEPPGAIDLPTFMQEGRSPAPEHAGISASVAAPQGAGYTETRELDVSTLMRPAVPFRSDAGAGSAAAVSQPSSPIERPAQSGETVEIDASVMASLSARPARAPEAAPSAEGGIPAFSSPPAASLGGPVPAPAGKRWVRFDPQTGKPLATPVLEDIPVTPNAAPPAPSTGATCYTAETVDIDPALIAEVLKRGPAPFRR